MADAPTNRSNADLLPVTADSWHEVADRTSIIIANVNDFIIEHHAIAGSEFQARVENVIAELAALYGEFGNRMSQPHPPQGPVKVQESYADRQAAWVEANGIEVGSKVRVARRAETAEDGWSCWWNPVMTEFVGNTGTVDRVCFEGVHIQFTDSGSWYFPYFVLAPIAEVPEPAKDSPPSPIAAGGEVDPGWRLLESGEAFEEGDEIKCGFGWQPIDPMRYTTSVSPTAKHLFRRRVAPRYRAFASAELPARVLAMCRQRDWSLHWTARGAYLHLEASELIEALRGKRGDPTCEAADVLLVLMSITESNGIKWADVESQAATTVDRLMDSPRYAGEEFASPCGVREAGK